MAKDFNSEQVASEHLMLAILHDDNNIVSQRLEYEGITYNRYKKEVEKLTPNYPSKSKNEDVAPEPQNVFQDLLLTTILDSREFKQRHLTVTGKKPDMGKRFFAILFAVKHMYDKVRREFDTF